MLQNIFMMIFQEECIMMRLKTIRNTTERINVEERREERRKGESRREERGEKKEE